MRDGGGNLGRPLVPVFVSPSHSDQGKLLPQMRQLGSWIVLSEDIVHPPLPPARWLAFDIKSLLPLFTPSVQKKYIFSPRNVISNLLDVVDALRGEVCVAFLPVRNFRSLTKSNFMGCII